MDLGLSQLTVASARSTLGEEFFPGDASSPKFLDALSEVIARFHTRGSWVGAKSTFSLAVRDDGMLYLPFFLDSILGVRIDKTPRLVYGQRYEFLYDGPGEINVSEGGAGRVFDRGLTPIEVTFPNVLGVVTAGTLRFTVNNASDSGKKIRVLGSDANGRVVDSGGISGEEVTLTSTTADTTASFTEIQGIQKAATLGSVTCHHIGTANTLLATFENFITHPLFRSYAAPSNGAETITCFCKRRALPVTAEEDYIMPGNISALRMGLLAKNYEENNDAIRASQYWTKAHDILNGEAVEYLGNAIDPPNFSPWGPGVSGIRNLN